jgi:hypothetical protein
VITFWPFYPRRKSTLYQFYWSVHGPLERSGVVAKNRILQLLGIEPRYSSRSQSHGSSYIQMKFVAMDTHVLPPLVVYPCAVPGLGTPAVREEVATDLWCRPFTLLENSQYVRHFKKTWASLCYISSRLIRPVAMRLR